MERNHLTDHQESYATRWYKVTRFMNIKRTRLILCIFVFQVCLIFYVIWYSEILKLNETNAIPAISRTQKDKQFNEILSLSSSTTIKKDLVCGLSTHNKVNRIPLNFYVSKDVILYDNVAHNLSDDFCKFSKQSILYLIGVPTSKHELSRRNTIRETWGSWIQRIDNSSRTTVPADGRLIFVISGQSDNFSEEDRLKLRLESELFQDLVIIETVFPDQYQFLSLKLLTILQWLSFHCNVAKYFVKADIDSFWNIPLLTAILRRQEIVNPNGKVILGYVHRYAKVSRNLTNVWSTRYSEYEKSTFPNYLAGGPGYILSNFAVESIYRSAENRPSFWLEDVYITGILADKASLKRIHMENIFYCKLIPLKKEIYNVSLAVHYLNEKDIRQIWSEFQN